MKTFRSGFNWFFLSLDILNISDGYGKISQCITTTKHSKAKIVCIFLGIYCRSLPYHNKEHQIACALLLGYTVYRWRGLEYWSISCHFVHNHCVVQMVKYAKEDIIQFDTHLSIMTIPSYMNWAKYCFFTTKARISPVFFSHMNSSSCAMKCVEYCWFSVQE